MPGSDPFQTLDITLGFLDDFASKDFTRADRRAFRRALARLDGDEQHPSLRVHQLTGDMKGTWSASASTSLRIMFVRLPTGRKAILGCSKHYGR
jgi:mRNA-degrading endonuclease YafQ of YafQ-DinJ toxin-antitoxin module